MYIMYWGLLYVIFMAVVAKFTVVLLAWLIETTAEMNLVLVTVIIIAVGLSLFLLPPVPGVPIYLTGGILIPNVGQRVLGGIAPAVIYTCFVSIALKLLACTLQQKAIGVPLSGKVYIRQLVGMNSGLIRTMRLVLGQRGLNIAKVAILVGGPDWPTSVLCGIMDLGLFQILLGTLPVFFLIVPTVLAGTFVWMSGLQMCSEKDVLEEACDYFDASPKYDYATTLSAIFLTGAGMVQSGSMVVATVYLEAAVRTRGGELDAIPIDKEVALADEMDAEKRLIFDEVTQWHLIPLFMKLNLLLGSFCIIVSCYLLGIIGGCFVPFQLGGGYTFSGELDNKGLDGNVTNFVLRNGVIAMGCFGLCFLLLNVWWKWAESKVQAFIKSGKKVERSFIEVDEDGEEWTGEEEEVGATTATEQVRQQVITTNNKAQIAPTEEPMEEPKVTGNENTNETNEKKEE